MWPSTAGVDDDQPPASRKFIDKLGAFCDLDHARRQLCPPSQQSDYLPARLIIAVWAAEARYDDV
jgi:hypothetical protein